VLWNRESHGRDSLYSFERKANSMHEHYSQRVLCSLLNRRPAAMSSLKSARGASLVGALPAMRSCAAGFISSS
jgi:hypothetical protein